MTTEQQDQQAQQQTQQQTENKDFSEDVAEQNFEQNGETEQSNGNTNAAAPTNAEDSNATSDPNKESQEDRKLFVGGLSWETSEKELREHFTKFGEIESINIKTDSTTGRSRGFAFIVFSKAEALNKTMEHGDHIINNKRVDPKKAKARHGKIFVGGLTSELSDDDIKNYFSQFGTIVDVEMPFDKTKNQRKGFCFITFESEQVANELLKTLNQTINNKEVHVKKATPRQEIGGAIRGMGRGGRGIRGGRGGRAFGGQGGWGQGYGGGYGQGGYDCYGGNYDYYGGGYGGYGGYGGSYDYSAYDGYGYGSSYDGGYSGGRGGARGKGGSGFGGKQRGGRQNQRHQPY